MALCVAYACILGWVATPSDSAHHMAQTDVSTVFYRILAPTGMNISYCQTCLFNCFFVKVLNFQIICDICLMCLRNFRSWRWLFLGLSTFVKRWWRVVYWQPATLLMDRHRAPAVTRDSICFGVYVEGVCAVDCDRPKVLSAIVAVKATLDAAGLQCSEVEADTSRQVFTGLQLDHETEILSLASRIWRLRHGLEFAACQKQLTGDQVAKLIGHITWSCLLRRPTLSLINAGYRFARTDGCGLPSRRNSDGARLCCRS